MTLEFRKASKVLGTEAGYYFKGVLLNRYKSEAIKILRERIEKAGSEVGDKSRTNWEKGVEVLPDEAKVIYEEYESHKRRTNKIHEKKKPYYRELHKRVLKRSLVTLQEQIRMKEMRKAEDMKDWDNSIQALKDKMAEVKKELTK